MYKELNFKKIHNSKLLRNHYVKASLWVISGFLLFALAYLINNSDAHSVGILLKAN